MVEPVTDLAAGLAAEHLVCADLLLKGYRAFLAAQTCPYDIAVECNGRLVRIQVKSTRCLREVAQRVTPQLAYMFFTKRAGKGGKRFYAKNAFDLYALVALDIRCVAYLPALSMAKNTIHLKASGSNKDHPSRRHRNIDEYPFEEAVYALLDR